MVVQNKHMRQKRAQALPVMYKDFLFSIKKPSQDGRIVKGYFSAFGNRDSDKDIVIKGAFAKSILERGPDAQSGNKIAHLWQHEMDKPLGKIIKLMEDDYGLYFECEYSDIQLANDALTQIQDGTLDKFSIGYSYVWDKMACVGYCKSCKKTTSEHLEIPQLCPSCASNEMDYAYLLKEVNLYEGSLVTLAANDMAVLVGVKSETKQNFIALFKDEFEDAMQGVKQKNQYALRQVMSKFIALANLEPVDSKKEDLQDPPKPETDPLKGKGAAPKKKGRLSALSKLSEVK